MESNNALKCSVQGHQKFQIEFICLETECFQNCCLICEECTKTIHKTHQAMKLQSFLNKFESNIQTQLNRYKFQIDLEKLDGLKQEIISELQKCSQNFQDIILTHIKSISSVIETYGKSIQASVSRTEQQFNSAINHFKNNQFKDVDEAKQEIQKICQKITFASENNIETQDLFANHKKKSERIIERSKKIKINLQQQIPEFIADFTTYISKIQQHVQNILATNSQNKSRSRSPLQTQNDLSQNSIQKLNETQISDMSYTTYATTAIVNHQQGYKPNEVSPLFKHPLKSEWSYYQTTSPKMHKKSENEQIYTITKEQYTIRMPDYNISLDQHTPREPKLSNCFLKGENLQVNQQETSNILPNENAHKNINLNSNNNNIDIISNNQGDQKIDQQPISSNPSNSPFIQDFSSFSQSQKPIGLAQNSQLPAQNDVKQKCDGQKEVTSSNKSEKNSPSNQEKKFQQGDLNNQPLKISRKSAPNSSRQQCWIAHDLSSVNDMVLVDVDKLVTCSDDSTIKIWDKSERSLLTTLEGHQKEVKCLAYYSSPRILASAGNDLSIKIWKPVPQWQNLLSLKSGQKSITALLFFSDKILISGAQDNSIKVWDIEKQMLIKNIPCQSSIYCLFQYTYKQEQIMLGGCNRYLYVFNEQNWEPVKIVELHKDIIKKIMLVSRRDDKPLVCTCSKDSTIKALDYITLNVMKVFEMQRSVNSFVFIKEYDILVVGLMLDNIDQGKITLVNFETGQKIRELTSVSSLSNQILWDTVNKQIYMAFQDGNVESNNLLGNK